MALTNTQLVNCVANHDLYADTQVEGTCHVCLSTGTVIGLVFQVQAGFVSLIALMLLLGLIARNYRRNLRNPPKGPWRLFRGNIDILMLNLIFADIWMSIGAILSVYWVNKRQVHCGSYCDAQGAIQVIGETASAFANLLVTVYTFVAIYLNRGLAYRPWSCLAVVTLTWIWVILWSLIPPAMFAGLEPDSKGVRDYYTPTPWWCWINKRYTLLHIIAEYIWLWAASGIILLYVPTYFMVRRNSEERDEHPEKMLYYPLAFAPVTLPVYIMRWAGYADPALVANPTISMVFTVIFYLMGLTNVLLAIWTRPAVLLIGSDGQLNPTDPREVADDDFDLPQIPMGGPNREQTK